MSAQYHGRYCGPLPELRTLAKRGALLTMHPTDETLVMAQFDGNNDWRYSPEHKLRHPETGVYLCRGWHEFPRDHFENIERLNV